MAGSTRTGVVAPLLIDNVNTDLIIRSRDIPPRAGDDCGRHLFACWRGRAGAPFVLDRPEFRAASLLLTGANFGCGSSREAAVWALRDAGIEAIIAPSFGSIFAANCVQNQIVPVVLPSSWIGEIATMITAHTTSALTIDIERSTVVLPDGRSVRFELTTLQRTLLGTGHTAIDLIRAHSSAIADFQSRDQHRRPWVYQGR
ncbi:3-isopropylmalate dehydratase small subunit [Nocardia sp. 2YAB30]|uniref:3-isopropylmalate dehydratase small subunit n=1 Tax=unclassified Nocardia TaxID=2637762 RepID=UPI003F9D57C9